MHIVSEFRKFALRGNFVELAIGIIIGGAFYRLETSLVDDLLIPFVRIFLGHVDFSTLALTIGETTIKYGSFLQSIVDFLVVSVCVFMLVKAINVLHEDQLKIHNH